MIAEWPDAWRWVAGTCGRWLPRAAELGCGGATGRTGRLEALRLRGMESMHESIGLEFKVHNKATNHG